MILYIDINDNCGLRCGTCPRGVRAFPNTSKQMSLPMFRRVVEKGRFDGAYQVGLFNWVEPFLVRNLHEYTAAVKSFGLRCEVASTLSLKRIDTLVECLRSTDMLWVTTSGYSQEVYEINHAAGSVEHVREHCATIAAAKRAGEIQTDVLLRFLMFDYNQHETEMLREFAELHGFRFEVVLGSGHPMRMRASADRGEEIGAALSVFSTSRFYERAGEVCPLLFEHIAVNTDGDVYQCSAHGYHPPLKIGSYLELSREEILLRRYNHPFCNSCDWRRREATPTEAALLSQALDARLGRPIADRIPRLSEPDAPVHVTAEGYHIAKDGHRPW